MPKGYKVFIDAPALAFIEYQARNSPDTETGGVLAGRGSLDEGEIHITHASAPGPNAKRTRFSFARDTTYCQKYLDQIAYSTTGLVDYLGEWHKHHQIVPWPSWRDLATAEGIARNNDYHINLCLLLIIGASNSRSALRAFVVNTRGRVIEVGWSLCEDAACFEGATLTSTVKYDDCVFAPSIDLGDEYDRKVSGVRESQKTIGSTQKTGNRARQHKPSRGPGGRDDLK